TFRPGARHADREVEPGEHRAFGTAAEVGEQAPRIPDAARLERDVPAVLVPRDRDALSRRSRAPVRLRGDRWKPHHSLSSTSGAPPVTRSPSATCTSATVPA